MYLVCHPELLNIIPLLCTVDMAITSITAFTLLHKKWQDKKKPWSHPTTILRGTEGSQ